MNSDCRAEKELPINFREGPSAFPESLLGWKDPGRPLWLWWCCPSDCWKRGWLNIQMWQQMPRLLRAGSVAWPREASPANDESWERHEKEPKTGIRNTRTFCHCGQSGNKKLKLALLLSTTTHSQTLDIILILLLGLLLPCAFTTWFVTFKSRT